MSTSVKLEFHPIATIFPLMAAEDLERLAEDIAANGLREPLWLHEDGRIIDGRNRYLACQKAGIEPKARTWNEKGSLVEFVISENLHRRHLTASQLACVQVAKLPFLEAEARARQAHGKTAPGRTLTELIPEAMKGESREKAGAGNVNPHYVSDAKMLSQKAPELFESVKNGVLTIPEAKQELRKAERAQREEEAVAQIGPERLWALTDDQAIVPCAALITDPPYGILDEPWEPSDLETFTRDWLSRWNKCGADIVLCFWSEEYLFEGRPWFDESLTNYEFQQLLHWHYANNKSPQSRQGFKHTSESIFFYRRRGSTRQINISGPNWGDDLNDFDSHVAAVPQSNFSGAECKQHPAQKPVSVMRWLINATTQPGEMVCDPFAGSGTTGIAAVQLHRQFHGIEINSDYLQIAERRIAAYGQDADALKDDGPDAVREVRAQAVENSETGQPTGAEVRMAVHFSSDSAEWYTPPEIIERVCKVLGKIDLDPCSNPGPEPVVPAALRYTKEDDGLSREWTGRVYMNPPYGREIGSWVTHLLSEHAAGRISEAVALVPARVDTDWFRQFRDSAVCFIDGRLKFSGHENSAPFPSAVVYLGTDTGRFALAFQDLGDVWVRWQS